MKHWFHQRKRLRRLSRIPLKGIAWMRCVSYLMFALSGALSFVNGETFSIHGVPGVLMSCFLLIGGLLAAIGAATNRWAGEFTGLPMLTSSFAVFSLLVIEQSWSRSILESLTNFSILLAVAITMLLRWLILLKIVEGSEFIARCEEAGR